MLLYLKNLFSNAERHALEKQVMQDPFESEAFDGLSELSAEVFETDIEKLQSQINERTEKRKVWFWQQHYAIAASVLFLIGLGLTIAVWNTDKEPYQIVTNAQELEDAVVVNESVINEEIEKEELFQELEIDLNKQEETIVAYEEVDEEVLEEREAKESIQKPEFLKIVTSAPAKVAAAATDVIKNNVEEAAAIIESKTETEITNNESVVIEKWSGVILDNYGMPLSGVSVIVKGKDEGVVTDFDGNYSFEAPKDAQIEASYIGFEMAEISFENHKKVTLDEDLASLDEVVVVGYGTTKKKQTKGTLGKVQANTRTKTSNIIVEEALSGRVAGVSVSSEENVSNALITKEAVAPQGNDANFKQWVMTQLNPSKFEKDKEYNIDVTFVIDENGKVSAVEIPNDLKSSEKKHLKTIFESSPSWIPAQNKNGTIKESKSLVLWFHF